MKRLFTWGSRLISSMIAAREIEARRCIEIWGPIVDRVDLDRKLREAGYGGL